jgi:hypothetical protein
MSMTYKGLRTAIGTSRCAEIESLVVEGIKSATGFVSNAELLRTDPKLVERAIKTSLMGVIINHTKSEQEQGFVYSFAKRRYKAVMIHAGILKES